MTTPAGRYRRLLAETDWSSDWSKGHAKKIAGILKKAKIPVLDITDYMAQGGHVGIDFRTRTNALKAEQLLLSKGYDASIVLSDKDISTIDVSLEGM